MVQSLKLLCLVALRDCLRHSQHPYLHLIPDPRQRQQLLDLVLKKNIRTLAALNSLSSPEFLARFSWIDTQCGVSNDQKYLERLADALDRNSEISIRDLRLNLFGGKTETNRLVELNLSGLIDLIRACPSLESLHLRMLIDKDANDFEDVFTANLFVSYPSKGGFLNRLEEFEPMLPILENVENLILESVNCSLAPWASIEKPLIEFKRLKTLRLIGLSSVTIEAWTQFLTGVQETLTELEVQLMSVRSRKGDGCVLPFPLPQLKSFKIDDWVDRDRLLIDNLLRCPKLEYVSMHLIAHRENRALMQKLNEIDAKLELKMDFYLARSIRILEEGAARFRLLNIFDRKIVTARIYVEHWTPRYTTALENMMDVCQDLIDVQFKFDIDVDQASRNRLRDDLKLANLALMPLLEDRARASKLRCLRLLGDVDPKLLGPIFENCVGLEFLDIWCSLLFDEHLITWASKGARPTELRLENCDFVGDEGLVPVLKASGDRMNSFVIQQSANAGNRITSVTWHTLLEYCRNVKVTNMPAELWDVHRTKGFRDQLCADFIHGSIMPD